MSNEMEKQRVLSCLRSGHDLANDRRWIAMHIGLNDRYVRSLIEELRIDGYLICNSQDGRGYYIAETDEEILRQYRRDMARAMSILRRMKPFRKAIREMGNENQITFEDIVMDEYMILEKEF